MKPARTKFSLRSCPKYPIVIGLMLLLFAMEPITAQDSKLRFQSISGGIGIASSSSDTAGSGFGFNLDLATSWRKNIFSFYFNSGWNLNKDGPEEEFYELNLTYGRYWPLGDRWSLEGHLGVGWLLYERDPIVGIEIIDFPDNDIGFPLRLKLMYKPSDRIGIGLNPNINLNSLETTYSGNILLQYYFN